MSEKVPNLEFVRCHRDAILALADTYGAYNVRIFGSVARGTAQPTSDIDFLVTFPPNYKLLHHAGLITALKALLGVDVDTVQNDLSPLEDAIKELLKRLSSGKVDEA
jgi:uncharacterized protein